MISGIGVVTLLVSALGAQVSGNPLAEASERLRPYTSEITPPRFAFLVGNEKYSTLEPVPNALNDIRLMEETLSSDRFNFEVVVARNVDRDGFKNKFDRFLSLLNNQDPTVKAVALFYFAGHGFNAGSGNMIVPTNARKDYEGLYEDSIPLAHVVQSVSGQNVAVALFLIDACRNEAVGGYFQDSDPTPRNVAYGFASSPGRPALSYVHHGASNSPFASVIAAEIRSEGVELNDMLESVVNGVYKLTINLASPQVPSIHDLTGTHYFLPSRQRVDLQRQKLGDLILNETSKICDFVAESPAGRFSISARRWLRDTNTSIPGLCDV